MEKQFRVDILTPGQQVYSAEAVSLIVPAYAGYLGVLANHAPMIAELVAGKITIRESSQKTVEISSGNPGLLRVLDNNVEILLEAEKDSKFDLTVK